MYELRAIPSAPRTSRSPIGKRIGINVFMSETIRFKVRGLIRSKIASDNVQAAQQSVT
jgi:hypothetical protein